MSTGIKEYILIGGLTKFFECRQIIEDFKSLWDVKISIPEYSDYATAIGSVIAPIRRKRRYNNIAVKTTPRHGADL